MKTCQNILDRAIDLSTANQSAMFTGKDAEVLTRINYAQQRLFSRLAMQNRFFFVTRASVNSTVGAAAREVDLGALSNPPLERLLKAVLPNGADLSQVDLQDLEAELPPRFYPFGTKIIEVSSDWGASGAVVIGIWYAYRPTELNLAGNLTQNITVPDRFCEYLDLDFAKYIARKDFGRDSSEEKRFHDEREAVYTDLANSIDQFPGVATQRFILPVTQPGEKA